MTFATYAPTAAPAIAAPDASPDTRIRRALLNVLYNDQPFSLFVAGAFAGAIGLILYRAEHSQVLLLWVAGMWLTLAGRFGLAQAYRRHTADDALSCPAWEWGYFAGALLTAGFWGFIGWYAYPLASPALRGAVVLLIGGVVAAVSRTAACHLPSLAVYAVGSGAPLVLRLLIAGEPYGILLGSFSTLYMVLMIGLGRSFRRTVAASFRLHFENADLVAQLKQDIIAREAAEAALRTSESRLRFTQFALDRAQDLVAIIDRSGRLLNASQALCRITGRTSEELGSGTVWAGMFRIDRAEFERRWDETKRNGAVTFDCAVITRDGSPLDVEVNATFVEFDGKEAVCTISRDLTPRRAAEQEKARLQRQLEETQRLESLGVLAGGIAHDFNNLLTAILGNATLARDSLNRPRTAAEMLQQIETAANQAAGLCRQMLAYAGRGQLVVEPLDVSAIVNDTAKLLEMSAGRRARLELKLAASLPFVVADASQLRQIVLNLVHNAAEAISHNHGRIVVTTQPVRIDASLVHSARIRGDIREGEGVAITVTDNGCGMDPETQAHIFEPFFTTKFTGRGLGLAAVLGIVRSHRALLHLETQVGRGTTFQVTLAASPTATPKPVTPPRPAGGPKNGRALVIDDEQSVRNVARQVLERLGYAVETANDGDAALAACGQDAHRFDLVLVDLTMPGKDGVTTLRELRRRGGTAPAILMSGFPEDQVREHLLTDAHAGFLQKPFDVSMLRAAIDEILAPGEKKPVSRHP